jgi:tetratricopeptide (TPR) repeat protein
MDIDSEPDVQRSIEYLIRSEMAKDPVQSAPNVSQENFPILLYTYNRAAQDPPAQLRSGAGQAAAKLSSAETPVRWSTGTYKAREKHADVFGPRLGRSTRRIVSMDAGMDASTAGMVKSRTQTRNQDRDLHDIQQTKLKVARLCHQCGQLEPARTLFEKLLIPESVGRPIEDLSFNIYIGSRIAEIHLHEGNYKKAEDCFLDLDTKCRALHQHNEVLVLEVSIGLANAFDKRGRFDEASKRLSDVKKRLAAMRNAEDQESQSQARREMLLMMTKNALGLVHAHQGSFMFAKKFNDEAQQMAKQSTKVNPAVSQHTTRIDFNSAEISVYSGRYEEAKEQIDDVARKLELQFGIRNLATLECRGLQAELLAVLNKTSEAEERAEQTLKHMRKEFGKQHPTTLRLLDTLASVYLSQGRIAEAMDIAEHVWDSNRTNPALKLHPKTHSIAESTHGGPCYLSEVRHLVLNSLVALNETETNHIESAHPQTIDSLHTLARAHRAAGSLRRAEYHQLVVVETSIRCLGVHHPRTVSYLSDLASVYCEMGRWEDSQQIILPVLRWQWKRFLQDAWQDEAETVSDTSMREQLSEKIVLVKKGLRSMDHAHPSLLSALHWLGIAERERANGDLSLSEVILEVVVKWRTQHLGEMHAETLLSRLERVKTYRKAGLISEAYGDLQKVLHLQEVHLGEVHPDTLSSRHELGIIFAFQGQFTQAAKEHLMVQQLRTKLLGPQHLYTLHSQLELSHDYHQLGELRKSRDLLHAALRIQLQHLKKPDPGVRIYNEDEWDQTFARLLELALPDSSELELNATAETPYTVTYSSFISSIVALVSLNVTSASANSMETQPKEKPTPSNDSSLLAATNLQECLVDLQRLSYGDDAEQTLQSLNDLALLYQDQERWNAAKKLYKKVQKKLPASHRLCLAAQSNLATLYFQEGKLEAAEALQETVVAELEQAYPLDRTTLIESTFNLALTRRRLTERAGQPPDMSLMNDIRDMSEQLGHMHPLYLTIYETWEEWNRGDT